MAPILLRSSSPILYILKPVYHQYQNLQSLVNGRWRRGTMTINPLEIQNGVRALGSTPNLSPQLSILAGANQMTLARLNYAPPYAIWTRHHEGGEDAGAGTQKKAIMLKFKSLCAVCLVCWMMVLYCWAVFPSREIKHRFLDLFWFQKWIECTYLLKGA